jgi:hypothetical protein
LLLQVSTAEAAAGLLVVRAFFFFGCRIMSSPDRNRRRRVTVADWQKGINAKERNRNDRLQIRQVTGLMMIMDPD